jgi:hypothetical protein
MYPLEFLSVALAWSSTTTFSFSQLSLHLVMPHRTPYQRNVSMWSCTSALEWKALRKKAVPQQAVDSVQPLLRWVRGLGFGTEGLRNQVVGNWVKQYRVVIWYIYLSIYLSIYIYIDISISISIKDLLKLFQDGGGEIKKNNGEGEFNYDIL